MKNISYLLIALLLATAPALATPTPHQGPIVYRGFHGPAYLGKLARRPKQAVLDSLARARRLPNLPTRLTAPPCQQRLFLPLPTSR